MSDLHEVSGPWRREPFTLTLGEVHVLRLRLDLPDAALGAMRAALSADELARAERFRFEADRRRWVGARGSLRALLGTCLGLPPGEVRLCYGEHGKPALSAAHERPELQFSLAHSHDRALIAVALGRAVGADLERVRADLDHVAIARQVLGEACAEELAGLDERDRPKRFALAWTRHEARIKAVGGALAAAPPRDAGEYEVAALRPWPGYVAAVAARGAGWPVDLWEFGPAIT